MLRCRLRSKDCWLIIMPNPKSKEPSQRMLRVGEEIRHIMSETMRRGSFDDPALYESAPTINVTEVRVSPDLKHATAYVISLGGQDMENIVPALNDSAHHFQRDINNGLKMKFTPKVRFEVDNSFANADKIEKILKNISGPAD